MCQSYIEQAGTQYEKQMNFISQEHINVQISTYFLQKNYIFFLIIIIKMYYSNVSQFGCVFAMIKSYKSFEFSKFDIPDMYCDMTIMQTCLSILLGLLYFSKVFCQVFIPILLYYQIKLYFMFVRGYFQKIIQLYILKLCQQNIDSMYCIFLQVPTQGLTRYQIILFWSEEYTDDCNQCGPLDLQGDLYDRMICMHILKFIY
eukprot:TRINITY_DN2873_c0_g1_i1.p4 TRINITY_DN2873_c0_g1~~TRINITY_DN2873_c0_g1_i1.p4  ORF type:complete len:202 (-),score=-18.96 TRINITY_DN2873_c0_g1_i1:1128-1733(-)